MFFKGSVEKASSWRWMKLKKDPKSLFNAARGTGDRWGREEERIGSLELAENVGVFG